MIFGELISDYRQANGMGEEYGPVNPYKTYVVKPGDSLSSIAGKILGDPMRWKEIWNINSNITDPNKISIGQSINVPAEAVAVSSDPAKVLPAGPKHEAIAVGVPSNFFSSPTFLIGAAGVSLMIILMATSKKAST